MTRQPALVLALLALANAGCPRSETGGAADAAPAASASAAKPADAGSPFATIPVDRPDGGPLNAVGATPAEVTKYLNPSHLPPYSAPTGAVEGTLWVEGPPAPETPGDFARCPGAADLYGRKFREGKPNPANAKQRALADVIVAVTGYSGFFIPEREENARVAIEGCGFAKRTVTITFGQRLEVLNTTTEFWSPVLEPAPNAVIMMAPPKAKDPVRLYPKKPGIYRLVDHDRKFAVSDLYVLLQPLHGTTDKEGHYRIDGVPVGKLKVNARHPSFDDETSQDIEVQPNVVVKADLVLRYEPKDAGPPDEDAGYRPKLR